MRAALPALSGFLRGYLHQDYAAEHRSARGAMRAFLAAASPAERAALLRDWSAFDAAHARTSFPLVQQRLAALGAAWRPASRASLARVFAPLRPERNER